MKRKNRTYAIIIGAIIGTTFGTIKDDHDNQMARIDFLMAYDNLMSHSSYMHWNDPTPIFDSTVVNKIFK